MTTTQSPSPAARPGVPAPPENDLSSVVPLAAHQFESVSGRRPAAIVGAQSHDEGVGWSIIVEAVEMDGIPDSTSMLAMYRVELDQECRLVSFERLRRYIKSTSDPT